MTIKNKSHDSENVKKLKKIVIEHRSLAENDPENLLKYEEAKIAHLALGRTDYNSLVNSILDANE